MRTLISKLLLAITLASCSAQEEVWGEWDSVTCYACGLLSIDPEVDVPGSYSINPGEGKKMYNHSCDLMDNGVSGDVKRGGQELDPKNNYDIVWDTKNYMNCTIVDG